MNRRQRIALAVAATACAAQLLVPSWRVALENPVIHHDEHLGYRTLWDPATRRQNGTELERGDVVGLDVLSTATNVFTLALAAGVVILALGLQPPRPVDP